MQVGSINDVEKACLMRVYLWWFDYVEKGFTQMIYNEFNELKLSALGFGAMRLPVKDGRIDESETQLMVDYAIEQGVNYFDTAYPYHGGESETVIGRCLGRYPRGSWYLATKYPGHQISSSYDPADVFETQLKKCGVDYFDFYLMHNVCENSLGVYDDPKWGIWDYFIEQKKCGRIKHLGISSHARPETLKVILEKFGEHIEFCQIQLNYLDWTLQDARRKCEILNEYNVPIWVMEPVRGGKLASLPEASVRSLKALRPEESIASWCFRWLLRIPGVTMILSGMSDMAQMKDNIKTFSEGEPLSDGEFDMLLETAENLKDSLPCTACRYCCEGCPAGLNIPMLIEAYNDVRFSASGTTVSMFMDSLPADKLPSACIGCGACAAICPQGIDIPAALADLTERIKTLPNWGAICKEREEAARRMSLFIPVRSKQKSCKTCNTSCMGRLHGDV